MILYFNALSIFLSLILYCIMVAYFANDKLVILKDVIIGLSWVLVSLFIINLLNPYTTCKVKLSSIMVLIIPFIISIMSIMYFGDLKAEEHVDFKSPKIIIIISLIILNGMFLDK